MSGYISYKAILPERCNSFQVMRRGLAPDGTVLPSLMIRQKVNFLKIVINKNKRLRTQKHQTDIPHIKIMEVNELQ